MTEPMQSPTWGFAFHHGDRLRKARDERGLTQEELADLSAVSRASIANYEAGRPMRRLQGRALALALGVTYDWLADGKIPGEHGPGGDECAIRDSNPEPADTGSRQVTAGLRIVPDLPERVNGEPIAPVIPLPAPAVEPDAEPVAA